MMNQTPEKLFQVSNPWLCLHMIPDLDMLQRSNERGQNHALKQRVGPDLCKHYIKIAEKFKMQWL